MEHVTHNTMLGTLSFVPSMFPADLPGVDWQMHDDLCDCEYQAAGFWTNPYIGSTHKVRLCCLRARMREMWPDLFQDIPAYYDGNTAQYIEGTAEWNSPDADMPRAIWYRQLAHRTGKTLAEVRQEYADQEPPRRTVPKAVWDTLQAALSEVREATEDTPCQS